MIERRLNIENEEESIFLFGARQTGKTTFLLDKYPDAIFVDLLETDLLDRYRKKPALLREAYQNQPEGSLIIIDEIQQVPELLNEVHWLITRKHLRFILCGSSARKLRREGVNTLGGRAIPYFMYPLVSAEIPDFDLDRAVRNGMLPRHYLKKDATSLLKAYVGVYLKEEIQAESLVRNLANFSRFLEIAAITDGEMVNYQNIASDCGVSANTVKEYFQILEDSLLGFTVPAYTKQKKRRLVQSPRFYLFDVGVTNYLLGRTKLLPGTPEYGHAFEHLIMQEIVAYLGYSNSAAKLSYWRTYTQIEVDAVLGDAQVAIEIKSAVEVQNKHLKGLKAFKEEHPEARLIIVSQDRISRISQGVEHLYASDFLKKLWNGEIV
ncbi:MAG: ATP-binding protein [Paludibacteraceae bacterium]|nr:ATP-binding protein [Paludibacteraceae bacterium]